MGKRRQLQIIFWLSVLGVALAAYLTYIHYSGDSGICDINGTLACGVVSKSCYAEFCGVPVALIGLMGYFVLAVLSMGLYKKESLQEKSRSWVYDKVFSAGFLFLFSLAAFLVSGYLTYAEFFLIKALCVFCLFSQAVVLVILVLSCQHWRGRKKGEAKDDERI